MVLWTIWSTRFTFYNVGMTESFRLEPMQPCAGDCGEGTKLKLVRLRFRGWAVLAAVAMCVAVPGILAVLGDLAHAEGTLEERKLPMQFSWVICQPHCGGWISA